jgi:hypothetical protein
MNPPILLRPRSTTVATSLRVGDRLYEQRFQRCNKPNCSSCTGPAPNPAVPLGHGPYWYLCFSQGHSWRRIYIGKLLNTQLFVLPNGKLDHAAIEARRHSREGRGQDLPQNPS